MTKIIKKSASVTSKTNFVKYPQFEVRNDVPQKEYHSSRNGRVRYMVAVTDSAVGQMTAQMKEITTVDDKITYVHVDRENISGLVQYGRYPWSEYMEGFMNVSASPLQIYEWNIRKIEQNKKNGLIDQEMANELITDAKNDYKKSLGIKRITR